MTQQKIIRYVATNDRGLRVGEYHPNCKYTDQVVDQLREMHEDLGMTYKKISEVTGIPRHTVLRICSYQRRAQTYEKWKRVEVVVVAPEPANEAQD